MDRRRFLAGSLAIVAAAGLPKAKRKKQNYPISYKTTLAAGVPEQTSYELLVYHTALANFSKASDTEKRVVLKGKFYKTGDLSSATNFADFHYTLKSASSKDGVWELIAKFDKKDSGELKLPKDFPKDLKIQLEQYKYAKILGKKNAPLATLTYQSAYDDDNDMGCFLTTACVHHKKLADDCLELTTLRNLRDNFMRKSEDGQQLIAEYKRIGPKLIQSINECENKAEIYNYMYDHLVLPSVEMVNAGEKQQAVEYYREFVKGLNGKYL